MPSGLSSSPVRWLVAAADLLLGARCAGCGEPWWGACPRCRGVLSDRLPYSTCPDPQPTGFPPTVTCAPYDDVLRGLIVAHKEEQALQLTPLLADLLVRAVRELANAAGLGQHDRLVLIPVPSAAAALRRRGFDATGALARSAARQLRGSFERVTVVELLVQRRGTQDQSALSATDRRRNLSGSLRVRRRSPPGDPVILVDDLVTTGASLTESARVLRGVGAPLVGACTVAATQRRAPSSRSRVSASRD